MASDEHKPGALYIILDNEACHGTNSIAHLVHYYRVETRSAHAQSAAAR